MSYEDMKAYTVSIARGAIRPGKDDPKIWMPSAETFGKILSNGNRALLREIAVSKPQSMTELAALTGRALSNLSRTLRTMERYGFVRLEKGADGRIVPHVDYDDITLVVPLKGDRAA